MSRSGRIVVYAPRALKDLEKLPADAFQQIVAALERFATTGHGDVRKLTDVRPPAYRLRIGDWRVRFALSPRMIQVEHVFHRREGY